MAEFWKAGESAPETSGFPTGYAEFWKAGESAPSKEKLSASQTSGFPDVYDWICRLVQERSERYQYLPLNVNPEKAGSLFLGSQFTASDKVSLFLWSGSRKLFDLGMCSTGFDGEESRQKNTSQVFSSMYRLVYFKAFDLDLVNLEQVLIKLGTIESAKYKQAFNSLFSVACYSFLVHAGSEISESELQKLPCHRGEDVLSIIGSGFPDVYDWICRLVQERSERYQYLPLNVNPEKAGFLFLGSQFTASDKVSLFLWSGSRKLFDLGMCSTGFVVEESRQKNTFLVFLNMYIRVYFKAFDLDLVKLEQVHIKLGTIESAKYKQAFNSLFSVACYSFLVHARFEISESEVQKFPCYIAEDVLSIIGSGFPDVYDWICRLGQERSERYQYLPLNVHPEKAGSLFLGSQFTDSDKVLLFLSSGFRKLFDLGMCSTGFSGEESRQKNTFGIFWNIFARVYFKACDPGLVELEQMDIQLGTIESAKYKQAFNSLFSVACYSFLVHSRFEISQSEIQKFPCQRREDILSIIGPGAANLLLRCLSTEFTYKCVHGKSDNKGGNDLRISYCNSSLPGFSIINSYCPMVSMSRTSKGQIFDQIISSRELSSALSYQQLQCILQFRHAVNVYRDFIEVGLEIDNVECDVIRLHPPHKQIPTRLEDERHFPVKISITIGPQVESHVHSVSLTKSSQNPVTDIARGKTVEATFEPTNYPGLKISKATNSKNSIRSWVFEQSSINRPHVSLEWTLYDSTTGTAVCNYKPQRFFQSFDLKTWSGGRYSKACRAFTAQGGVVFARDEYGKPITWRLNRDLQGQTVNWVVKGNICLAYFPNTYRSAHVEIANHQFCQVVQFPLVQSTPN